MSRRWKWVLLAVLVLSIALNVVLIRSELRGLPHDALFVYPPADSFDQAAGVNQAVLVGGVAAFVGHGDLAPAWVPCTGQTLERADYPELFAALQPNHALAPRDDGPPAESPGTFTLPDLRGLLWTDLRLLLQDAEPDGLELRFLRWLLTARGVTQSGVALGRQAIPPAGDDAQATWIGPCVFAVRAR